MALSATPSAEIVTKAQADEFRARPGVHDFGESTRGFLDPEFVLVYGEWNFGGYCMWRVAISRMDQTRLKTMDYGSEQIAVDNKNCTALEERGFLPKPLNSMLPAPVTQGKITSTLKVVVPKAQKFGPGAPMARCKSETIGVSEGEGGTAHPVGKHEAIESGCVEAASTR